MTVPHPGAALLAEGLGTAMLLAAVVGSGVMAERLAGGNMAVALLANAIATGAALVALIQSFGPLSGAHFNPIVTLGLAATGLFPWSRVAPYIAMQVTGALLGVLLAHAMFDLSLMQISEKARSGGGQSLSEMVASFMLVTVILRGQRNGNPSSLPYTVALTVVAGYWYTASTSFANPAVTLARSLTDSFTGIRPADVPAFLLAQCVGASVAVILDRCFQRWNYFP